MTWMEPPDYVAEYYVARFYEKSFVMLEGTTDRALWNEFTDEFNCSLYPTKVDEGKDVIIDALTSSWLRDLPGFAGIVDADYWLIMNAPELETNSLLYDDRCPDMESILLASDALKKVLRNNLYSFDVGEIHQIAEVLTRESSRLAAEFGYFRLLNGIRDYGLKCNAIPMADVIDADKLELDAKQVASRLTGGRPELTSEDIMEQVGQLREQYPPTNPQLCRGKDVVAIIAHILPSLFKSHFGEDLPSDSATAFREKALAISLRSSYDSRYFKETSLYGCIRNWESDNPCYKILAEDI